MRAFYSEYTPPVLDSRGRCGQWVQPDGVRFGTTRPNQFRGPGGVNLDMSLFRSFPLGGTHRIEARVEATHVTNTFKFANPTNSVLELFPKK